LILLSVTRCTILGIEVNANMRHVPKPEFLGVLRAHLRELENAKLIGPDDLGILDQKRVLRRQIACAGKG